jgi:hypothetical protein
MKSHFDIVLETATGFTRAKTYSDGKLETPVAVFSKVNDPDIVVVYIPGGTAALGLASKADKISASVPNAFTWRWLSLWMERGVAVATVDFPTKFYKKGMPPAERSSASRIDTLLNIIGDLRTTYPRATIVGYGHSYGAIEMSLLSQYNVLDKIVVGSGAWNASPDTKDKEAKIFAKPLKDNVDVPFLFVQHEHDQTPKCNINKIKHVMESFDSIVVSGGTPHLGIYGLEPGPHFFSSQENEVAKNIILWLRDKPYSNFIN